MIYNLNEKFTKVNETKGVLENKSICSTIELVVSENSPEKDTGIELQPKEKMTFSLEEGKSLYARCTNLSGVMANLGVVNFNLPASSYDGVGIKCGADAPAYYKRDIRFSSTKRKIITPNRLWVNINDVGYKLMTKKEIDIDNFSAWDTQAVDYTKPANRCGKDLYIYACVPTSGNSPIFVLSANSTVPQGYTDKTSRKIGGFHTLCADVGIIADHRLSGYIAGDILPASLWDLNHRPKSEPEGMVYVDGLDLWVDIYLASYTGGYNNSPENLKLVSIYNGIVASAESAEAFHQAKFTQIFGRQKKRLLWQHEFVVASIGSNQGTIIQNAASVNMTGGHVDTAGRRMISDYGLEDCCGVFWQWGLDTGSASSTAGASKFANAYDNNDKYVGGQAYGSVCKVLMGGSNYVNAEVCGSRASTWTANFLYMTANSSGRAVSEALHGEY